MCARFCTCNLSALSLLVESLHIRNMYGSVSLAFGFERTELGHVYNFFFNRTYCVDPVNEKNEEIIRPRRNHRSLVLSFLNKEIRDEN